MDLDLDGRIGCSFEGLADGRDVTLKRVVGIISNGNKQNFHFSNSLLSKAAKPSTQILDKSYLPILP